jgi:hypothetical protein
MTTDQPFDWRAHVRVHPAADLLPLLPPEELRALADDISANGLLSFAVADKDGVLLDGRNRLDALALLDALEPAPGEFCGIRIKGDGDPIRWRILGSGDPYDQVLSLNIHRRHLTAEQKRDLIDAVLKAKPELSNRQIAEKVKADHHKVASRRGALEATGEISPVEKTIGADGKARKKAKTDPKLIAVKAQAKALGLHVRQTGSAYFIGDDNGAQVIKADNLDEVTERLAALRSKIEPQATGTEVPQDKPKPAVNAKDSALNGFDAHILELLRLTKG